MKYLLLLIFITGGIYAGLHDQEFSVKKSTAIDVKAEPIRSQVQESADRIRVFLEKKKSPCAKYAYAFAQSADAYRIDVAVVLGISGGESSYCKRFVEKTNNPFGFGYCDSCADGKYFKDIPHAINHVTKTITTHRYYRKFQKTKDCKDLAAVYLTGDRERWCGMIESTRLQLAGL